jgi:hypothetical protein
MKVDELKPYPLHELNQQHVTSALRNQARVICAYGDDQASDLAKKIDRMAPGIVLVLNKQHNPTGMLHPFEMLSHIRGNGNSAYTFEEALDVFKNLPMLRPRFEYCTVHEQYCPVPVPCPK